MSISICIGGDLGPTETNKAHFSNGDVLTLVGTDLLEILTGSDFRIFNLEIPLTDTSTPIPKWGPNLLAPIETVKGIKALNPSCLGLANNHILDQGEQGLLSTIRVLNKSNIPYVGAGENLAQARQSHVLNKSGKKIGIYACAEHEFSIATDNRAGANPFEPLDSLDHIQALKNDCDYVIVLYHGGKEHYRYPSPYLQKVCRKISEKGADLVVCQHSHCIGCMEIYNGSSLVYGQGNFIFDRSQSVYRDTSLIIRLVIDDSGAEIEYIPLTKIGGTITIANQAQTNEIMTAFFERSEHIQNHAFLEDHYRQYAEIMINKYINTFMGDSLLIRILKRLLKTNLLHFMYSKQIILALENYVVSEAHRELLVAGLRTRSIR